MSSASCILRVPGSEDVIVSRKVGIATLRAHAFVGEPAEIVRNGVVTSIRVPRKKNRRAEK